MMINSMSPPLAHISGVRQGKESMLTEGVMC